MHRRLALVAVVLAGCHASPRATPQVVDDERPRPPRADTAALDPNGAAPLSNEPATSAPSGPHVQWSLAQVESNRIGLSEMNWIEHGTWIHEGATVVWHRRPPGRLARLSMCCWTTTAIAPGSFGFLDPIVLADAVIFQEQGQLWVLSRSDGATLYDWSDNRTSMQIAGGDGALVDTGTLDVTVDGRTCTSKLHEQNFVRECGGYLVYFDRGLLGLFRVAPYGLITTVPIELPIPGCHSHAVDRTLTIDKVTVRVRGVREVSCRH